MMMSFRFAVGVPENCEIVEVDGVRLACIRSGNGPVLVCLHAVGHGGGDFSELEKALRSRFTVIRIDWPGQGRSGADTEAPSPKRYAQLLDGVLKFMNVDRPILLGNSIGAAAALVYAGQRPVKALILCDSGGLVPVNGFVRTFCAVFAWFFNSGAQRARWFMPMFRWYYRFLVLPQAAAAEQRNKIIRSAYETAPLLRDAWRGFSQADADLRLIAQSLEVPVWFAWAKQDRVIPLSLCMPCIRQMKQAQITQFSGGHSAFLEQPTEFLEGFNAFVNSLKSA
jgi:4,5:9,10-diseco-3-hydroxy-5,9,17-trioxoandrosta-1(10),2-diene-4-oate hydrolase